VSSSPGSSLGRSFAETLAIKDFEQLLTILSPDVDFFGLTPRDSWQTSTARELVEDILPKWFESGDDVQEILSIETDAFADCQRVAYRFRGADPHGPFVVEEQAYYTERDGRINWLRILCSGFRPQPGPEQS
jgi:hypothetical protein